MYTRGRLKSEKHFSFSALNENADENEIQFTAENETKTKMKMDIHFRPKNENESHLIILEFFFFFIHSVTKSALQCAANTSSVSHFFRRWPRPRPRLLFLSSRRLETKTLVSRTTSVRSIMINVSWGMLFLCFSTWANVRHVFKCPPLIHTHVLISECHGCVNCALFNAVPNVYLHNWKEWVMQQTKYRNNVIMTSVLGRRK